MKVNATNVKNLAERKRNENFDLRSYLKMQDRLSEEEVDKLVADTANRIWESFDCTACGNCCKELIRTITQKEVEQFAAALAISEEEFCSRYLDVGVEAEEDDGEGDDDGVVRWQMRGKPCPFLRDNKCAVYEARPSQCRKYPYLYEPDFSFRTLGMIERTFTCPIVYEVFEELKAELPFRRRNRFW